MGAVGDVDARLAVDDDIGLHGQRPRLGGERGGGAEVPGAGADGRGQGGDLHGGGFSRWASDGSDGQLPVSRGAGARGGGGAGGLVYANNVTFTAGSLSVTVGGGGAGIGTTGTRTVSPYGMASLLKVTANTWYISGAGVA